MVSRLHEKDAQLSYGFESFQHENDSGSDHRKMITLIKAKSRWCLVVRIEVDLL
jgi:hypothetical protein